MIATALGDFKAEAAHELPLRNGETVAVWEKHENGWWLGSTISASAEASRQKIGWFPSTFVEVIPASTTDNEKHPDVVFEGLTENLGNDQSALSQKHPSIFARLRRMNDGLDRALVLASQSTETEKEEFTPESVSLSCRQQNPFLSRSVPAESRGSTKELSLETLLGHKAKETSVTNPDVSGEAASLVRIYLSDIEDVLKGPDLSRANALRKMFDEIDIDGNGVIDINEFFEICDSMKLAFSRHDLEILFRDFDVDQSEALDFEEFQELMNGLRSKRQCNMDANVWSLYDNLNSSQRQDTDWERQNQWLELQMELGFEHVNHMKLNQADTDLSEPEKEKYMFRRELRTLAKEINDEQINKKQGVDEMQLILAITSLSKNAITQESISNVLSQRPERTITHFPIPQGSWTMRYRKFEDEILFLYNQHRKRYSRRMTKILTLLKVRELRRKKRVMFPTGSVNETSKLTRRQNLDLGLALIFLPKNIVSPDDKQTTRTTFRVKIQNHESLINPASERELWTAFPSRPVVHINLQEDRGNLWYNVANSSQILVTEMLDSIEEMSGDPKLPKFEISFKDEFFSAIPALELVIYDLEDGDGTAKVCVDMELKGGERKLIVNIREGKNLPKMDYFGLSDPYAKVYFGDQAPFITDTQYATLDPKWAHGEFFFDMTAEQLARDDAHVFIEIFDYDVDEHDIIGVVKIYLNNVFDLSQSALSMDQLCTGKWYHIRTINGGFVWGNEADGASEQSGGIFKKLQRYDVKLTRNEILSPDLCLGYIHLKREHFIRAEQTYNREMPKIRTVRNLQKSRNAMLIAGREYPMEKRFHYVKAFTAWKQWYNEQQNLRFSESANSDLRFAAVGLQFVGGQYEEMFPGKEGPSNKAVSFRFTCERLPRFIMFGLVDSYLVLKYKKNLVQTDRFTELARTKVAYQNLNPEWEPLKVSLKDLENNALRLEVWGLGLDGTGVVGGYAVSEAQCNSILIGYIDTTLELLQGLSRSLPTFERDWAEAVRRRKKKQSMVSKANIVSSVMRVFSSNAEDEEESKTLQADMRSMREGYGMLLTETLYAHEYSRSGKKKAASRKKSAKAPIVFCRQAEDVDVGYFTSTFNANIEIFSWEDVPLQPT